MTISVKIPNGIMTLNESKAQCPYCDRKIPFDWIESKWARQDSSHIRMKCKCKKYIGITQNIMGDFVAYELKTKQP